MKRFVDIVCLRCGQKTCDQYLDWNEPYPPCACGGQTTREYNPKSLGMVIPDDIPGGIEIRHGVCNDDGTPKRYYSRTDIRKAAKAKGMIWGGDEARHIPLPGSDRNPNTTRWV